METKSRRREHLWTQQLYQLEVKPYICCVEYYKMCQSSSGIEACFCYKAGENYSKDNKKLSTMCRQAFDEIGVENEYGNQSLYWECDWWEK